MDLDLMPALGFLLYKLIGARENNQVLDIGFPYVHLFDY